MDNKQFDKALKTLSISGKKLNATLHELSLYALSQVNLHGNTTAITSLLGAMSASMRKEALMDWASAFGLCKKGKAGVVYVGNKKITVDGKTIVPSKALVYANDTPFFEFIKESNKPTIFDVQQAIVTILKKAEKFKVEGLTVEHADLLSKLSSIITVA